jgi:hypothetical protein
LSLISQFLNSNFFGPKIIFLKAPFWAILGQNWAITIIWANLVGLNFYSFVVFLHIVCEKILQKCVKFGISCLAPAGLPDFSWYNIPKRAKN